MRSTGRILCACAFATLLATVPAVPQAAPPEKAAPSTVDISRIHIDNFGRTDSAYYRGGQPIGRDFTDLAAIGVKTVIDLQADGDNANEEAEVQAAGMRFYRIPMTTRVAPTKDQIAAFLKIVNDPAHQPVYVHCKGGRHRTGVMTAVYRMDHHGWAPDRAFTEMKQYKFGADFLHPEFKKFVYAYAPQNVLGAPIQAVVLAPTN